MEKSRRFEYTFITLIYSEDFIDDFIHKMKFSKGFNVQWIIFDKSGQKNTNIFKKLKRYNIIYRSACLTWSDAKCYNLAMGLAEGKYICFTNQYISYDKNTLKSVSFATSKYPDQFLICISYKFEEEKKKRIHMSLDLQNIHGSIADCVTSEEMRETISFIAQSARKFYLHIAEKINNML